MQGLGRHEPRASVYRQVHAHSRSPERFEVDVLKGTNTLQPWQFNVTVSLYLRLRMGVHLPTVMPAASVSAGSGGQVKGMHLVCLK